MALALPAAASAHGSMFPGFSEQQLRSAETALLGPEHAAEHARLRRFERNPKWRRSLRRAARRTAASARLAAAEPRDAVGHWNPNRVAIPSGFAINAVMLPTGKVLWFGYPYSPDYGPDPNAKSTAAYLWDPRNGDFKEVPPPRDEHGDPVNLFCAGTSFLPDGQVLVTGGNLAYPGELGPQYAGLEDVYTFNPYTETWTTQPDMRHGRWYPSQLLMPDGRTFIIAGLDESGAGAMNRELELFTPPTQAGQQGTTQLIQGPPPEFGDFYPHLFWMPSGRGLVFGPYTTDSWFFNVSPNPSPTLSSININSNAFDAARVWGTAVLVPNGSEISHEVMQIGGSDKPSGDTIAVGTSVTFDETQPGPDPRWDPPAPALNVARSHHNTVLLPDGSMVTVGGGRGSEPLGANGAPGQYAATPPQRRVELWDPATGDWRLGPAQQEYRAYHSTAVLLPDGRVVSAGDDYNGATPGDFEHDTAELYEPPYLFDGDAPAPRPVIAAAPTTMTWEHSYAIGVDAAAGRAVTRAVLVAPSATTHAVDMNQRYVPLRVQGRTDGSLIVSAPPNENTAPTGRYMLFVLDETGTPSVARWVQVGSPPPVIPQLPADPGPGPPQGGIKLHRPRVYARFVRRSGRRLVQLRVTKSNASAVRVRITLRNRRHRAIRKVTVTVKPGRRTTVRSVRVPSRARSVDAAVRSLRV